MNEYDSNKIGQLLNEKNDVDLTDSPDKADLIVLNTCSIREKAEVKVYSD
jgi:tRNA-2-methylthio-N6-dimethylallyladenosine synthase